MLRPGMGVLADKGVAGREFEALVSELGATLARPDRRDEPYRFGSLGGVRQWIEQGYKQVKSELGWADFQVRTDRAIRRHWTLVCCAFSFCWQAWFAEHPTGPAPPELQAATAAARGAQPTGHRRRTSRQDFLAGGVARGAGLADPLERAVALLAIVVAGAPASSAATAA